MLRITQYFFIICTITIISFGSTGWASEKVLTIAEIREEIPEYGNLTDKELFDKIRPRFKGYSTGEVAKMVGYKKKNLMQLIQEKLLLLK